MPSREKDSEKSDPDDATDDEESEVMLSANPSVKELKRALEDIQKRMAQVIEAVDDQRNWNYRTILFFGMIICTAVIFWIGSSLWHSYTSTYNPPEVAGLTWTDPVMVDGKPVRFGVGVIKWDLPKELIVDFEKMALEELAKQKAATQQAAKEQQAAKDATTQPATQK